MSSPFGPMLLVCNSRSGRGGVAKALPLVEQSLRERELEYEIAHTEYAGHAIELARKAIEGGTRFLVAVGGDGTIHEVVNGMIENDAAIRSDAVLGVVAAGTGSDFIKTLRTSDRTARSGLAPGRRQLFSHRYRKDHLYRGRWLDECSVLPEHRGGRDWGPSVWPRPPACPAGWDRPCTWSRSGSRCASTRRPR